MFDNFAFVFVKPANSNPVFLDLAVRLPSVLQVNAWAAVEVVKRLEVAGSPLDFTL